MTRFTHCEWCDKPLGMGTGGLCSSCDRREIWRLNPIWRVYEQEGRKEEARREVVGSELVSTPTCAETLVIKKQDGVVHGAERDGGVVGNVRTLLTEFPTLPRDVMSWPRGARA